MTGKRLREIADKLNLNAGWRPTATEMVLYGSELRALADQLERNGWKPISTAPKDGADMVLIWPTSTGRVLPIGVNLLAASMRGDCPEHLRLNPTHWQPLPKPPEAK